MIRYLFLHCGKLLNEGSDLVPLSGPVVSKRLEKQRHRPAALAEEHVDALLDLEHDMILKKRRNLTAMDN